MKRTILTTLITAGLILVPAAANAGYVPPPWRSPANPQLQYDVKAYCKATKPLPSKVCPPILYPSRITWSGR